MSKIDAALPDKRDWCVHLPSSLRKAVKIRAAELDLTMYEFVTLAVERHLAGKKHS